MSDAGSPKPGPVACVSGPHGLVDRGPSRPSRTVRPQMAFSTHGWRGIYAAMGSTERHRRYGRKGDTPDGKTGVSSVGSGCRMSRRHLTSPNAANSTPSRRRSRRGFRESASRHVKEVARTALWLADLYGVDPFEAQAAGLLHDWDKKLPVEELWDKALAAGVVERRDERIEPLLHGWTAAATLPEVFPSCLPRSLPLWDATRSVRSTCGRSTWWSIWPNGIEPGREGEPLDDLRSRVGKVPLDALFALGCRRSLEYLLEGGRYMYPGGVDVWNAWCDHMPT